MSEKVPTEKEQTPFDDTNITASMPKLQETNPSQDVAKETTHGERGTKRKKSKNSKKIRKRKKSYRDFIKAAMVSTKRHKEFTLPAAVHFKKVDRI